MMVVSLPILSHHQQLLPPLLLGMSERVLQIVSLSEVRRTRAALLHTTTREEVGCVAAV